MPIGNLFGGGATKAANIQANAATQAAQIQSQSAQQALDFQKQVYGQTQQELAPWLNIGTNSVNSLSQLMGLGGPAGQGGQPGQPFGTNTGLGGPLSLGGQGGGFGPSMQMNALGGANRFAPMMGGMDFNPDAGTFGGGAVNRAPGTFPTPSFPGGGTVSLNGQAPGGVLPGSQAATNASGVGGQATVPAGQGQGYLQPFTNWNQQFQAPTNVTEANDPGYQFRLQQGQQALENSAAARGGLLSGGTMKAEQQYGQDYASNEYSNVYNRALGEYQQNYNIFQNQQNTQFNRLAALSGMGQTSAAQLGGFGQQAAFNTGNLYQYMGNAQASGLNNAAAARASGYTANQNATNSGMGSAMQLAMLAMLA